MKNRRYTYLLLAAAMLLVSCAKDNDTPTVDEMVQLKGMEATMGEMTTSGEIETRNVDDFAVNTANDPTHSMAFRTGWHFDLKIYKGSNVFTTYGEGSLTWNSANNRWEPSGNIYFPNYTKQKITVDIYPNTLTTPVAQNQVLVADLQAQDILEQNGNNYVVNPAHIIPNVQLHHKRSMLDIILREVNSAQIATIEVVAGGISYQPHKIPTGATFTKTEYLLILPTNVTDPVVNVTTVEGARYTKTLEITTAPNVCYCVNLLGLELELGNVTISDWTYGRALSGNYSVVTSYPTFKGTANTTGTVTYRNGQTQTLTFNSRGEATTKPAGRTIVAVNGATIDPPIVLRGMMIDLTSYL